MSTKKYVSLNSLSNFLDNLKILFATKDEVDNKSNKDHMHGISDISNLESTLNSKAAISHGTHVSYSTTVPVVDGTASIGSASTVSRSDHRHPTDTSRASQADLDIIESLALANKAAIEANASALDTMQTNIEALANKIKLNEENLANFAAITSQEINTMF